MARTDLPPDLPECLTRPRISLIGDVAASMTEKLMAGLADARDEDLAIELTTIGGDAEMARRMVLEIGLARRQRRGRLLFLGKSAVYSAGATIMSAFPRADRFLTADTVLLLHERQLSETIDLSGSIRASVALLRTKQAELENGLRLEQQTFERLAAGTSLSADQIRGRAEHAWYVTAQEAAQLRLVEALMPD
jgi:ATP-dependent protease ClpP protease subunit